MATSNSLLNYINTYAEIATKGLDINNTASKDYLKLIFTGDGDIITHGINYTQLFSNTNKGLVPMSSGDIKEVLRGNGTWGQITTTDLPIAPSVNDAVSEGITNTTILTTAEIISYVGNMVAAGFEANNAMRYLGSIRYDKDTGYSTTTENGTIPTFPTTCKVGDTYSIRSSGTYAGETATAGDLIICIKDGDTNINTSEYWVIIEANINGVVRNSVNGTSIYTYSTATQAFNIYAPTTSGTEKQVLISKGSETAPEWVNQSELIAGDISTSSKKSLFTEFSTNNGEISITIGDTNKKITASGNWGINITGIAAKVANALSAGTGLLIGTDLLTPESYDGSKTLTISLITASSSNLGGVIIDRDNTNKTITVDNGNIYLTKQNIINALGFTPAVDSSVGSYNVVSNTADGLAPKVINTNSESINNAYYILASSDGSSTPSWYKLPSIAFQDSWRDIQIGGNSIGEATLNFIPSGDVYVKVDSDDGVCDLSFGLNWYNISTEEYETLF